MLEPTSSSNSDHKCDRFAYILFLLLLCSSFPFLCCVAAAAQIANNPNFQYYIAGVKIPGTFQKPRRLCLFIGKRESPHTTHTHVATECRRRALRRLPTKTKTDKTRYTFARLDIAKNMRQLHSKLTYGSRSAMHNVKQKAQRISNCAPNRTGKKKKNNKKIKKSTESYRLLAALVCCCSCISYI